MKSDLSESIVKPVGSKVSESSSELSQVDSIPSKDQAQTENSQKDRIEVCFICSNIYRRRKKLLKK